MSSVSYDLHAFSVDLVCPNKNIWEELILESYILWKLFYWNCSVKSSIVMQEKPLSSLLQLRSYLLNYSNQMMQYFHMIFFIHCLFKWNKFLWIIHWPSKNVANNALFYDFWNQNCLHLVELGNSYSMLYLLVWPYWIYEVSASFKTQSSKKLASSTDWINSDKILAWEAIVLQSNSMEQT
jgi:hypothetical protein